MQGSLRVKEGAEWVWQTDRLKGADYKIGSPSKPRPRRAVHEWPKFPGFRMFPIFPRKWRQLQWDRGGLLQRNAAIRSLR
ncbi:hypothetical protein NDU88_004247 [Pleurodeles waltl]|uniref:Uncharacterized protein n=1 Tax=Pleurodeles waltl TaxID=8319 RepID=A0AAV7T7L4_PLEWA|nr:hypothetical protein NDU88_004247 [Pleurodeles waltl]